MFSFLILMSHDQYNDINILFQVLGRNVVSHGYKIRMLSTCTYCENNKFLFDNKQLIYKQHVPSSEVNKQDIKCTE